ncbi:MAG: hypothetical protein QOK20_2793 [Acidimicrobiaceae bacterium]|nr:hypothetical protein [Acidimicrobiaceae bacterium]
MQSNPQPLGRGTGNGDTWARAPARRMSGRCPAVDVAVIDEFRSWFGPERTDQFATLVLSYQTEAEAMIVQLASDAGNEDRPSMARTLHKLQGSSATIGAGSVAHLCATVDVFTSPDLSAVVSELAAEQGRFVAEIQVVLADRPAG